MVTAIHAAAEIANLAEDTISIPALPPIGAFHVRTFVHDLAVRAAPSLEALALAHAVVGIANSMETYDVATRVVHLTAFAVEALWAFVASRLRPGPLGRLQRTGRRRPSSLRRRRWARRWTKRLLWLPVWA